MKLGHGPVSAPLMSPEVHQDRGGQLLQGPGLRNETHLSVVCVIMDQGDTERMCRDAHCGQASCIRSLKGF